MGSQADRHAAIAIWSQGTEQRSITSILIFVVNRIVRTCFHKVAGIAEIDGVVHSDPNDHNDHMETRLKTCIWILMLFIPTVGPAKLCLADSSRMFDVADTLDP